MATAFTPETTVGRIVTENPAAARVLERFGLDYCCGGKRPLRDACTARSVDATEVLRQIEAEAAGAPGERSWSEATMTELADHIERTHHDYLKRELPRLAEMLRKVERAHGSRHPEVGAVADIFERFADELTRHMQKEEAILFPVLRDLERTGRAPRGLAEGPIACMVREHDDAGAALAKMRELTNGYAPPPDACTTFRVALASLAQLEADMHRHVHKENSILFPAAVEKLGLGPASVEPVAACCAKHQIGGVMGQSGTCASRNPSV